MKRTGHSKTRRGEAASRRIATKSVSRVRAKAKRPATAAVKTASKPRRAGTARRAAASLVAKPVPMRGRAPRPAPRTAARGSAPSAAERATGIPVHVITVADLSSGDPGSSPGSADFAYRILAEGDSWFTIGGIPSSNLLYEMRLPKPAIVCNIAYPGDTLKHVAELANNHDLRRLMTERFGYRWHAILLSAGGNDLVDRAPLLLRNPGTGSSDPRDYLVTDALEGFVLDVQNGLRTLVGVRDGANSVNHGVPVIVHGYDYPTPRNAPARFLTVPVLGPWLQRAYDEIGIDATLRLALTDFLVDVLAEAVKVMTEGPTQLPQLHFVETRRTLQRAAVGSSGTSGDWLNEIHPSHGGYRKIAARISAKLTELLAS